MKEDKEIKTQEDGMNVEKLKTVADYLQTVTDLRTRLEEMMKKADAVGDAQFVIEVLTKNLNERNAENAALKQKFVMNPQEFERKIKGIIKECEDDPEEMHRELDGLMEDTLKDLGYIEGIALIQNVDRWYV